MLFGKKKKELEAKAKGTWRYSMLEPYGIDISNRIQNVDEDSDGKSVYDVAVLVAESKDYYFYRYDHKHLLRQRKVDEKDVRYFGYAPKLLCVFHEYLFTYNGGWLSNHFSRIDVETGVETSLNWLPRETAWDGTHMAVTCVVKNMVLQDAGTLIVNVDRYGTVDDEYFERRIDFNDVSQHVIKVTVENNEFKPIVLPCGKKKPITNGSTSPDNIDISNPKESCGQAWRFAIQQNIEEAKRIWSALDNAGFEEASIALAMYTPDQEERKKLVKKAADKGNYEGLWEYSGFLPHSYIPVDGNPKDDLWMDQCLRAAEAGSTDAMNEMGNIFNRKGHFAESMYWYAMARANDHPDGEISMNGIARKWAQAGCPRQFAKGSRFYTEDRHTCAIGYLEAYSGQTPSVSLNDFIPLVLNGLPIAAYLAGEIFESVGNDEMAYRMFNAIAFENDAHGISCLADMVMAGKGTQRDPQRAISFYLEAADGGDRRAMFVAGQIHGNSGNKNMAAYYLGMAHARGYKMALPALIQLG